MYPFHLEKNVSYGKERKILPTQDMTRIVMTQGSMVQQVDAFTYLCSIIKNAQILDLKSKLAKAGSSHCDDLITLWEITTLEFLRKQNSWNL